MTQKTMLVTGATGMVGSFVARRGVQAGYDVSVVVRKSSPRELLDGVDVKLVEGDLSEPESLTSAIADADIVVHSAAHVGDWGPAEKYRAINVVGRAARDGAKRRAVRGVRERQ